MIEREDMNNWKKVRVGDIGKIVTGKTPRTSIQEYYGGSTPFITPSDDMTVKYIKSTRKKLTTEGKLSVKNCILPKNAICVSCIGSDLGKVVITTEESVTNQQINSIIVCEEEYDIDFIYYRMKELGKVMNFHSKTSTAVPIINKSQFSDYTFMCPEKYIQIRIGEILSAIDGKIANNDAINRNLSEQAQAYFDELFIQNASVEWKEGILSDVGSIVAGGTPSKSNQEYYTDNGIAWITPKDLSVDKSAFISHGENDITELGLQKSSATMMPAGTVLFSSRAPIGYIAIAANEICTNQGFKSVVPNDNVGTSYVYYLLKQLLPTIENMASGSTFKEISGSAMKIVPTVIPDDETLKRFSDFCDPIMKQIQKNEQESKRLVELRDTLLPKLMSGELDVSDLKI